MSSSFDPTALKTSTHHIDAPIPIAFIRTDLAHAAETWQKLFASYPVYGHVAYGICGDTSRNEYLVAVKITPTDPADVWGLEKGEVAAGWYIKKTLEGNIPDLVPNMPATFNSLINTAAVDSSRACFELYHSKELCDIMVPVAQDEAKKFVA